MATQEPDTQEPKKMSDEQLKALKRQVSGIPHSLYTAAPAKPEANAKQSKAEQSKTSAEENKK
jgi:hypothetical protein